MLKDSSNSRFFHAVGVAIMMVFASTTLAVSGEADVVAATARQGSDGLWTFKVSVRHADAGWDHYADRWEVLTPSGDVLATRVLVHPHVNEQPFTRSLSGITLPDGLPSVVLRAHDSVHGYGGEQFPFHLSQDNVPGN